MLRSDLNTQKVDNSQFYIDYLSEAAAIFEDAIQRLKHCENSQCSIADAIDMAHRIKGNAAMYDYPILGLNAAEVEKTLRSEAESFDHANKISILINLIDEINQICRDGDRSEPQKLRVTLAVENEDPVHVSQSTAVSFNRKSILIGYQDVWVCDLMASLLAPEYEVINVQSREAVIGEIRSNQPDLVVLEDVLGGEPTIDWIQDIVAAHPESPVPIYMAFGSESHEQVAKAISLGVSGFATDKHDILEIVNFVKTFFDEAPQSVLVVDDDPMVQALLKHTLSASGYRVSTASDGIEALDYLSQNAPDIILLDRFMPRLEGGTVLYEIQNKINLKSIPVLILTAMVNRGEAKTWFERGAADFIPKPFDPDEVLMRVKQHLEVKQKIA